MDTVKMNEQLRELTDPLWLFLEEREREGVVAGMDLDALSGTLRDIHHSLYESLRDEWSHRDA